MGWRWHRTGAAAMIAAGAALAAPGAGAAAGLPGAAHAAAPPGPAATAVHLRHGPRHPIGVPPTRAPRPHV